MNIDDRPMNGIKERIEWNESVKLIHINRIKSLEIQLSEERIALQNIEKRIDVLRYGSGEK